MRFPSGDLTLVGEIFRVEKSSLLSPLPAVILCHGIPATKPQPDDRGYAELAEKIAAHGFLVLIFNFRGTGVSEGDFDLPGWADDVSAAVDLVLSRGDVRPERLAVAGFSGGAAAAVYAAAKDDRVKGLALCACPARFDKLAGKELEVEEFLAHARQIGIIKAPSFPEDPAQWWRSFQAMRPEMVVDKISPRPLFIIHGSADETVPAEHAMVLFQRAREPKELVIIGGAPHRLRHHERAMKFLVSWLGDFAFSK